jgi:hypothetical protein
VNYKKQLPSYTETNYTSNIERQLLNSKNTKTLILRLKNLKEEAYTSYFNQIVDIMKQGTPLVNFYIAKNIPKNVFQIKRKRESIMVIWNH